MKSEKFLTIAMVGLLSIGLLAGCGGSEVDENKTPEEIRQEIVNMDTKDIQKQIDAYTKAIAEKMEEVKVEAEKLSKIPLTEQLGDEAKAVRANLDNLKDSAAKLQKNLEAYAEGLKEKSAK